MFVERVKTKKRRRRNGQLFVCGVAEKPLK
jgi:hypothetical protein